MSAFENATAFFHACETLKGWDECKQFIAENAPFTAQCEPLVDIKTVEQYVEWMTGFGTTTAAGCSYDLHASAYDDRLHPKPLLGEPVVSAGTPRAARRRKMPSQGAGGYTNSWEHMTDQNVIDGLDFVRLYLVSADFPSQGLFL